MLSRVADSIYWMARYVERAENLARLCDVNQQLLLDLPESAGAQWMPIVYATGEEEQFAERFGQPTQENVVRFVSFDLANPSSILQCLTIARENARGIREIISSEMWEQVNRFWLMVRDAALDPSVPGDPHAFFTQVKQASHTFVGIAYLTMTHNEAWHFARMGRLLERADATSRILDVKHYILLPELTDIGTPFDELHWTAILKSASAFEMYRKQHGVVRPASVAEFLLLEHKFPRSVRYGVTKAERSLHAITGRPIGSYLTTAEQKLGRLRGDLEEVEVTDIVASGMHEWLDALQNRLAGVGAAVFDTFFALRPLPAASTRS
ncbi:MAG: alpha-E domain-containing protein [Myxococcales bacterium]|nr:alpha-E domain-containing protein [Myxococcales bacterium]